jgi:hypothetical protein
VRSAEVRKFSVGKRRAEFVRGGKAMDGMKRAGMTALGRAASNASKRGLAKKRFSFMAVFVITNLVAAHVQNPGRNVPCDVGKMGSASPKAKTLNVKVLSHDNALISNDFSCNRGYRAEGAERRRRLET